MDLKSLKPAQRAAIELAARAVSEAMAENVNSSNPDVSAKDVIKEILNQTPHTWGLSYMLKP